MASPETISITDQNLDFLFLSIITATERLYHIDRNYSNISVLIHNVYFNKIEEKIKVYRPINYVYISGIRRLSGPLNEIILSKSKFQGSVLIRLPVKDYFDGLPNEISLFNFS